MLDDAGFFQFQRRSIAHIERGDAEILFDFFLRGLAFENILISDFYGQAGDQYAQQRSSENIGREMNIQIHSRKSDQNGSAESRNAKAFVIVKKY